MVKCLSDLERRMLKKGLENYGFVGRKANDEKLHPNNINQGELRGPESYLECVLILIHPLYNSRTANNVRRYVVERLEN